MYVVITIAAAVVTCLLICHAVLSARYIWVYVLHLLQCDKAGGNQLKVTQFHFTSWPDHGVPEYAGPILNYLRRIKKLFRGPTLVHCRSDWKWCIFCDTLCDYVDGKTLSQQWEVHHLSPCSAGVGRTGTLMAIDMALEQAAQENVVDIPSIITKMRRQRMKMVQNSVRETDELRWNIYIKELLVLKSSLIVGVGGLT